MILKVAEGFFDTDTCHRFDEKPKTVLFGTSKGNWFLCSLDLEGNPTAPRRASREDAIVFLKSIGQDIPPDLADPVAVEL